MLRDFLKAMDNISCPLNQVVAVWDGNIFFSSSVFILSAFAFLDIMDEVLRGKEGCFISCIGIVGYGL